MASNCSKGNLNWRLEGTLTLRVFMYWNRLPREIVQSLTWAIFSSGLERHLPGMVRSGMLHWMTL